MQHTIIIASESGIAIRSHSDINDAIGACYGADALLLTEVELSPQFFDLKSGLAGEAMQKFANYGLRVAIVVPHPERHGERFVELAREHATHPAVRFVRSIEEGRMWLEEQ